MREEMCAGEMRTIMVRESAGSITMGCVHCILSFLEVLMRVGLRGPRRGTRR